jgi:MYND finger
VIDLQHLIHHFQPYLINIKKLKMEEVFTPECFLCHKQVLNPVLCPNCEALNYCSIKCLKQDRAGHHNPETCRREKEYMQDTRVNTNMPFPWYPKSAVGTKYVFLKEFGVFQKGAWVRELGPPKPYGSDAPLLKSLWRNKIIKSGATNSGNRGSNVDVTLDRATLAERLDDDDWWVGHTEGKKLLTTSLTTNSSSIDSWESYCTQRELPLTSILPSILDMPLTVYWAVQRLKKHRGGTLPRKIVIGIAGVEKEIDQWPVFVELGALLPENDIILHFIGPEIPSWADNCSVTVPHVACGNNGGTSSGTTAPETAQLHTTKLRFHAQLLETVLQSRLNPSSVENLPDIIVGLNAGLGAYQTWMPSLYFTTQIMMRFKKPSLLLFTDYGAESTYVSRMNCNMFMGAAVDISEAEINPFRKPLWMKQQGNNMPYAPNGFAFWMESKK